ncbi:hypothetical protein G7B40_001745 [Aetokthonos hydrillicola Thurmond2011]|jgi:hypothetical protein|uniref:Uncharacterized protein n=1 Tax=Aetokthonos hydrillicola Thurmond2011 TaxID=2712845 RepID=A0AAP5I6D8_9CYAN|nr:hypothetical protein [Aetokthonos hydrillicola]MBO3462954.1 hypothetical protein [Aetokthonos hydrillicola CCALA 1050]MBW4590166.1 hypothetical protein [Aetokthonos hydrillicola CCALA 1050]MDR9893310.1 hypothetical protein [Aetokthonos hydrillicola Thurmond2011]
MTEKLQASVFEDIKVIGDYEEPEEIASKLEQMKDPDVISSVSNDTFAERGVKAVPDWLNLFKEQPWMYATYRFGYIGLRKTSFDQPQPIQDASAIAPDPSLKNNRINIRLDRFHIQKYPGGGTHDILVTFAARNQVAETQESLSFSQTYRVREGQSAGIAGYPVFIGLHVGLQGIAFECSTVNVKNEEDKTILSALESSPFQSGLKLLTTAQPAIAPFTQITLGVVKLLAQRYENVAVQKFYLGLDFDQAALGVSLAEGNYIAVQVPDETAINWSEWIYKPDIGAIVRQGDNSTLPYNYIIFRITKYEE